MIASEGFVSRQMRRVSRNLLIWNGLVLVGVAVLFALIGNYLGLVFRGPRVIDDQYLLDAARNKQGSLIDYVDLPDHPLIPTGYREESSNNGRVYSIVPYHFTPVGDKFLIVKGPSSAKSSIVGPLESISVKTDREIYESIVAKNPELKDDILPLLINAEAAFNVGAYVVLVLMSPFIIVCGLNVFRAFGGVSHGSWHPVMKWFRRSGPPVEVAAAIDAQVDGPDCLHVGKAMITPDWLLRPTIFRVVACRLDEVVWAFHSIINGDHIASFAFRDGRMVGVPLQKNTPELLGQIFTRLPWVERGWTKEQAKEWRTDRSAFIARVDARREQHR